MKNNLIWIAMVILTSCTVQRPLAVYVRQPNGKWLYMKDADKQEIRKVYNLKDNAFKDLGTDDWKPITQDTIVTTKLSFLH